MKDLKDIIQEKLTISSNSKVTKSMSPELQSIWDHFEMDKLYTPLGYAATEPFLTEDEGKEMIEKLDEFLRKNKWDATKFKYFIRPGYKFKDKKIAKDFKKHNQTFMWKSSDIGYAKDKETIFKKDSLRFDGSASEKLLGMYGPFGGSKIVEFEEKME